MPATLPFPNVGAQGLVFDRAPTDVASVGWTNGRNIRFRDGYAEKFLGDLQVFGSLPIVPYWAIPVPTTSTYYWLYLGLAKAYATDGIAHTDITRTSGGDYLATALQNWTGCVLGGIPVVNNGVDDPQMWNPVSPSQALQLLTNWPANTKVQALRSFKNFLVGLDVTKTGTRYPQMIKWSHGAPAGGVPSSWDPADPTKDAGEYLLAETSGFCVDSLPLRDVNVVYKEDSVHAMQFVGGVSVFRFFQYPFAQTGILSRRCVVGIPPGRHAVFGPGDCFWHDGQTMKSILDGRARRRIYNNIDSTNIVKSFVFHNYTKNEVWFCFPETGATHPNIACVWNYVQDTLGFRDLPGVPHIEPGLIDQGATSDQWQHDTQAWSQDTTTWGQRSLNPALNKPLILSAQHSALLVGDEGNNAFAISGAEYSSHPGTVDNYIRANISIPSPTLLTMRTRVAATDYTPALAQVLVGRWTTGDPSWHISIQPGGTLRFTYRFVGSTFSITSSAAIGETDGTPIWLKVIWQSGGSGTCWFYKSTDYNPITGFGTWVDVGTNPRAGPASGPPEATVVPLVIGALSDGAASVFAGKIYYLELGPNLDGAPSRIYNPALAFAGATIVPDPLVPLANYTLIQTGSPAVELEGITLGAIPMTSFVERKGLGVPFKTGQPPDMTSMKFFDRLWPRIDGTLGAVINVYVGTHDKIDDEPVYMPARQYTIGQGIPVDALVSGRLFAVRYESVSDCSWRLLGHDIEASKLGNF